MSGRSALRLRLWFGFWRGLDREFEPHFASGCGKDIRVLETGILVR